MASVVERIVLSRDFGSNCYVVRAEAGGPAAVVDPGGDPAPLLGTPVDGILVTHTDIDHVAGVAQLAEASGAAVWAPAGEADALRRGETRTGHRFPAHDPEHIVAGGDTVVAAGIAFEVVAVPGHSQDHIAFCTEEQLFSGDLLFAGSVGRADLAGGDWDELVGSIERLLERFGPGATVYPGHGEPTTLGRELATNPFLGDLRAAR
jgi:hydroxyacylglutathione hydrolase